jgi:carbon storage regulator CsrA
MLVLSRKADEALEFPELGVVIRVVSLKKTKVHLGIDAPQRIRVRRTELRSDSSDQESSAKNLARQFDSHRLSHELSRLESQIAALTELASRSNRELAAEVAADSQKQIDRIHHLLVSVSNSSTSDGVADSRSQDSAWGITPEMNGTCVRQASAEFTIGNSQPGNCVEPIYQLVGEQAVWFPGARRDSDYAVA